MAFHVACPITCRKICYCTFGTPGPLQTAEGRELFLQDVLALETLLARPTFLAAGGEETVEVLVPRLAKDLKPKKKKNIASQSGWDSGEETPLSLSKKAVMRKKVTMAAIAVAEAAALAEQAKKAAEAARVGAARQLAEVGALKGHQNGSGEVHSTEGEEIPLVPQVVCELCLFGEVMGSKRAERMVLCPVCKKRYHRNCLKRWAGNRDLFNWSSWVCGSCRICEVCRRTGEPNKLMFCKRCDGAYHAYCQQPQFKHVPKGPFLCPKHTCCHSCSARVPGSGVSTRWFLGYTTCDSCGRLFMRGKYCPICLKVYRDSEASPMVCCDSCEHWVHCQCDGISDEKYHEFQLDHNLHYKCAACRGDCYRVKDLDDATDELWRRRDEAERDLIAQMQSATGISNEENLKSCPSSDEEEEIRPFINLEERQKKGTKLQPLKGKDKDGKSFIKIDSSKKKNDSMEKAGSGASIKKLKITLPKPDKGVSGHSFLAVQAAEQKESHGTEDKGRQKPEKVPKKKNGSVGKLIKLGNQMTQDGGDIASNEMNNATLSFKDQSDSLKKGLAKAVGNPVSGDKISKKKAKSKKSAKSQSDKIHNEKPVKTVKFVSNSETAEGTKVVLHLPSKGKGNKNKVKMKIPSVSVRNEGILEDAISRDKFSEVEGAGMEGFEDDEYEETDTIQSSHYEEDSKDMQAFQQNSGAGLFPIHSWGVHTESLRRRRMPSSKYRDMDVGVWKSMKPNKDSNASSEKRVNMVTPRIDSARNIGEAVQNEVIFGRQGVAYGLLARTAQRDRDKGFDGTPGLSQDDDSSGAPRKRLKVVDIGGRHSEEEGRQAEVAIKGSAPKVSLKLKLKKPVAGGDVQGSGLQREGEKCHDDGSAIRGQRSKRKRHHLLETDRFMGQEEEGEHHDIQGKGGKISDDSWILQKLGTDAIDKRVEVFRPRERSWCKGTVTAVLPQKSQFTVSSDDGRQETIEFGKRSVRLLSHSKKRSRS